MRLGIVLTLIAAPALAQQTTAFVPGQRAVTKSGVVICPSLQAMDDYLIAIRAGKQPNMSSGACLGVQKGEPVTILEQQDPPGLRVRVQYNYYNRKGLTGWMFASSLGS